MMMGYSNARDSNRSFPPFDEYPVFPLVRRIRSPGISDTQRTARIKPDAYAKSSEILVQKGLIDSDHDFAGLDHGICLLTHSKPE